MLGSYRLEKTIVAYERICQWILADSVQQTANSFHSAPVRIFRTGQPFSPRNQRTQRSIQGTVVCDQEGTGKEDGTRGDVCQRSGGGERLLSHLLGRDRAGDHEQT